MEGVISKRDYYDGRDFRILPEDLVPGQIYRFRESSEAIKSLKGNGFESGVFALETTVKIIAVVPDEDYFETTVILIDEGVESGVMHQKVSREGYYFRSDESPDDGYYLVSMADFEQQFEGRNKTILEI